MNELAVEDVVQSLRDRVAQRRANGDYPPGLEEQLEAEFAHIMQAVHRHEVDSHELAGRLDSVGLAVAGIGRRAEASSRVPGGSAIHAGSARLVVRHTDQLAAEVRSFGAEVSAALIEVRRLIDAQRSADERQLHEVIASLLDRVAVIDHVADAVVDLEVRLASIESRLPMPDAKE